MTSFLSASTTVWLLRAFAVVAVFCAVMWVKGRIEKSYELAEQVGTLEKKVSAYEYMFKREVEFRKAAEKAALEIQAKYDAEWEKNTRITRDVGKKIVTMVPKNPSCDYDADVVSMLNRARGYSF